MIQIRNKIRNARGVLKTEAMLATVLLVAAMGFASTMIHRINRLWGNAQRHQFAIGELSNQIDSLVRLTPQQASVALDSIDVSQACKETLKDASLSGVIEKDELGNRVTLQLTWIDRKDANPVELSAWIPDAKTKAESTAKADGGEK